MWAARQSKYMGFQNDAEADGAASVFHPKLRKHADSLRQAEARERKFW